MSGFLTKVDLMVAIVLGFCGIWPSCYARSWRVVLDSTREHLVEIFWAKVNSSGSFSMNYWKSPSWSNLSFRVSGITFLQMSTGLMVGIYVVSSCVI